MISPAVDIIQTLTSTVTKGFYLKQAGTFSGLDVSLEIAAITVTGPKTALTITKSGHYSASIPQSSKKLNFTIGNAQLTFDLQEVLTQCTLSFDVDLLNQTINNLAMVAGLIEYTWEQIYGPIAIESDTSIPDAEYYSDPTRVVRADGEGKCWGITYYNENDNGFERSYYLVSNPTQLYINNQAVRYVDIDLGNYSESSL